MYKPFQIRDPQTHNAKKPSVKSPLKYSPPPPPPGGPCTLKLPSNTQ